MDAILVRRLRGGVSLTACGACHLKGAKFPLQFCTRATMIHDAIPHRIFRISELTGHIASHLALICPKSTVKLACVCRYLEEPVLSTLWETQSRLDDLLRVLPEENWDCNYPPIGNGVVCGLDPLFHKPSA